jgi:hypothetical protein
MIAFKSKDELQIEEYFKHDQSNDEALSNDLIDNIQKKNSMFIETLNPNDQINVYMVFSNKLEKNINNHL